MSVCHQATSLSVKPSVCHVTSPSVIPSVPSVTSPSIDVSVIHVTCLSISPAIHPAFGPSDHLYAILPTPSDHLETSDCPSTSDICQCV